MGLLDWFQSRWKSESKRYKYSRIKSANVVSDKGETLPDEPFAAGDHYFRLWLVEMFLKNDIEWFTAWHPAVHAAINFRFGDREELITRVAGASLLPDLNTENLDRVVGLNYAMTPLMPFNGGVIELSAGLLAIAGKNDVKSFLKVLGDFSNLLMVPQLSTALALATPLASGVSELVGATENRMMLGLHQTWTAGSGGAASLRAGYFAVISADDAEVDNDKLWINDGRLKYGESLASAKPFRGYNYMLFRLERRDDRDDWDSLTAIREPYNKAIEMLRVGNTDQADAYIRSAKAAAFLSNELTRNVDQRRVVVQLQQRYDDAREQLSIKAFKATDKVVGETNLSEVMQGAMSTAEARSLGSLLPEDVGLEGLYIPDVSDGEGESESDSRREQDKATPILSGGGNVFDEDDQDDEDDEDDEGDEGTATTSGVAEQFYFAIEGDRAKGDAVQFGTNIDLLFNYAALDREVLAVMQGRELERARKTNADLGITVIPKGFSFRSGDSEWYKVARFRGGRLEKPVRFLLRAIEEEDADKAPGVEMTAEQSLPVLRTGFQIIFEMNGITLYHFPLAVRLVRSIAEVEEPVQPRPPLMLNLDKAVARVEKALEVIKKATEAAAVTSAIRSVFEAESQVQRETMEGRSS